MKSKFLFAALLLVSFGALAECEDKFAFGGPRVPGDFTALCNSGYATIHDNYHKIPFASFEHLTPDHIGRGKIKRTDDFRPDPRLPVDARSTLKDYKSGSQDVPDTKDKKGHPGYDRGHMADAQDSGTLQEMHDTFFLSNMVPQVGSFNRGMWKNLETHVAEMVRGGRELYVISGAVPGPTTIGPNQVNVPSAVFKVVIDKKNNDAIAYLIPNAVSNKSYKDFQIKLSDLNHILNVDLVPTASDALRNATGTTLK